jgi:hypothetical protein
MSAWIMALGGLALFGLFVGWLGYLGERKHDQSAGQARGKRGYVVERSDILPQLASSD